MTVEAGRRVVALSRPAADEGALGALLVCIGIVGAGVAMTADTRRSLAVGLLAGVAVVTYGFLLGRGLGVAQNADAYEPVPPSGVSEQPLPRFLRLAAAAAFGAGSIVAARFVWNDWSVAAIAGFWLAQGAASLHLRREIRRREQRYESELLVPVPRLLFYFGARPPHVYERSLQPSVRRPENAASESPRDRT